MSAGAAAGGMAEEEEATVGALAMCLHIQEAADQVRFRRIRS